MTTRNKVLLGILGAAAVGAIIGLLTKTEKGRETSKLLRKTAGKWVDSMGRIFSHSSDGITETKSREYQASGV